MALCMLADAPDAVPYAWVAVIVGALVADRVILMRQIAGLLKREQDRADALAGIVNSFVVAPNGRQES